MPPEYVSGRLASRLDQLEPVEQLGDPPSPLRPFQVVEVGHQRQVLLAGQERVHRRELAGHSDHVAHGLSLASGVVTGDAHLSRVRLDQGGQDVHRRRLARAVGPEQREDRSGRHAQVDPVERRRCRRTTCGARTLPRSQVGAWRS